MNIENKCRWSVAERKTLNLPYWRRYIIVTNILIETGLLFGCVVKTGRLPPLWQSGVRLTSSRPMSPSTVVPITPSMMIWNATRGSIVSV